MMMGSSLWHGRGLKATRASPQTPNAPPAVGQRYEVLAGSHKHIQRQNNEQHRQDNVGGALQDVEKVFISF